MAPRRKKPGAAPTQKPPPAPCPVALVPSPVGEGALGESPHTVEPLRVTARIRGAIALPNGPLALDALLAAAVARREGLPPPDGISPMRDIEIPVARAPGGRFHLASLSECEVEERERRWVNRRFPIPEAQAFAVESFKRINIAAGAQKSYRLPLETAHLAGDALRWWCLGDRGQIAALLALVPYLGKRRATGLGAVVAWEVERCEPWPGFPVVRDGRPLRPLPPDWPGLAPGAEVAWRTMTFPYWEWTRRELCAVPPSR